MASSAACRLIALIASRSARCRAITPALEAFLQAFATNLVQAAIRLGVLGQEAAVACIAALEDTIIDVARCAARSTLDDIGGCTFVSDVAAMRHEVQYSRLFRS